VESGENHPLPLLGLPHIAPPMHCIYNWVSDVRVGPQKPPQNSGTPDQAGGDGTGAAERPDPIYEQDVEGERRFVYYGETNAGRLLAVVVTERAANIRVVTAYDLDAGQRREYLNRRTD